MTTTIRRLTKSGVEQFDIFLKQNYRLTKDNKLQEVPFWLLYDQDTSEPLNEEVAIDAATFPNSIELGTYLSQTLTPIAIDASQDQGLWSWLGLFYFNQICPEGTTIWREYRYRFAADYTKIDYRDYHRHLLFTPYDLITRHNGEVGFAILAGVVHESGDLVEQIMSRQELRVSKGILKTIDLLYWDDTKKAQKPNWSSDEREGALPRFLKVIDQLSLNFDITHMDTLSILELLPDEFDDWLKSK